MAEEDLGEEEFQTPRAKRGASKTKSQHKNQQCRTRIDQLAIPSRRLILALYQDHADHLSKDKVEKIKALLQELYAMTPEETEKYFEHLRRQSQQIAERKNLKFMLKRILKRRKKSQQIKKAYGFLNNILIKSMEFACKHPIPALVSVRLRNLSDIVLEQICDLRDVKIPSRENPDEIGWFLIQVADWMAVAIEHLYYVVHLKKNREMEAIEKEAREKEARKEHKPVSETEGGGDVDGGDKGNDDEEGSEVVLSEALLVSEME